MVKGSLIKTANNGIKFAVVFAGSAVYAAHMKGSRVTLASALCKAGDVYDMEIGLTLAEERLFSNNESDITFGNSKIYLKRPPFVMSYEDLAEWVEEFLNNDF